MNLCLLSDGPIRKRNNSYYYAADTALKFFMENVASYFDHVSLCVPVIKDQDGSHLEAGLISFDPQRIRIVETYPCKSVAEYYLKLPFILKRNVGLFYKEMQNTDVIFLRLPAMNAFLIYFLNSLRKKKINLICYFEGNEKEIIVRSHRYRGLLNKISIWIASLHSIVYQRIVRAAKVAFFLSSAMKNEYACGKNNAFFIFTSLLDDADIHRRPSGPCSDNKIKLLYVGRLSHEKGIEYLLKSIQMLRRNRRDVTLQLCGDGPEKKNLQILCRKLEIEGKVEFTGFVPQGRELNKVYSEADIFILPSLSEGVPKVLLEAMSKGLPVITTEVGGIPDIIKHNENGILIPPGSPAAISEAIESILENRRLRDTIIENGYNFILEHTAAKQAKVITDIIYQKINEHQENI